MISVADGQARILDRIDRVTEPETIPVAHALGRVLAEDLIAPFDVPSNDNSAVDGYAISSQDIPKEGRARLRVIADLPAGSVFGGRISPGEALRIMTGAPMPKGTDAVVPQEATSRQGEWVLLPSISAGANVRFQGEDLRAGGRVLDAGTPIRPQEMGLLASMGRAQVLVRRRPRVAILSTGDEVVEPGEPRSPGQIYDSNRFSLQGLALALGCQVLDMGIVPDQRELLRARLLDASQQADIVLTSGGVSVGVYDLVKEVLEEIGGIDFWQVNMTPGRPLAPGRIGRAYFFGLPGNPVASMVTFLLFVRPAVWKLLGIKNQKIQRFRATCLEYIPKKRGRREFKRGILVSSDRGWEVRTTGPQGSGILSSMVSGNCLIVLEEEREDVQPGEMVLVEPFSL